MPRLNEVSFSESVAAIFYSAPGVGKTDLFGSAGSRSLIIGSPTGLVTLQNPSFRRRYPGCNPFIEIVTPDEDPSQSNAYDKMTNIINNYLTTKSSEFDNIIIDDSSFLNMQAMNKAVGINFMEQRSQSKSKIGKYSIILPTMADFGTQMSLVEGFLINLVSTCKIHKKHLLVGCHEKNVYKKDKKTNEETLIRIAPLFTGRAAPESIGRDFDLIFRITRVGKEPSWTKRFQCHPDDIIAAKDRYSTFKVVEDNLDWPKILKRVHDALPALEDPTTSGGSSSSQVEV